MSLVTNQFNITLKEANYNCLKNTLLFSRSTHDLLINIASITQPILQKKSKIIYLEEEVGEFCYVICYGWIKLFHETLDGTEVITDVLTTGHIFGEDAIFYNNKYIQSAQVVEDSKLLPIPLSIINEQIHYNNSFAINMLSLMSWQRKRQNREIEHLSIQSAAQRIGCFLLRLCPKNKSNNITLYLPYDKTLIATRLGMKAETFSRSLKVLCKKTEIRINGSCVTINSITPLAKFICSSCSSIFPCEYTIS